MNVPCDDRQLIELIESDNDDSLREAADHVEQCSHCQMRMETLAGHPQEWKQARDVLLSTTNDCSVDSQLRDEWTSRQQGGTAWSAAVSQHLLSPPTHPEMLGRIGRYDVERVIGSGGMGIVYKAHDTELSRAVAVKMLAPHLAENGSARQRFSREARAAAAVVDEHVVPIHNVEAGDPGKAPFLVMKYVAGGSLQERIDRDGPLDLCEILRIGMHASRGLAAAHAQGLIHRDVKPSNILLDEGVERALLTDFGLARTQDDACLTRSGFHPGTPHYMSPEQVRGDAIDPRSDLFSLGCVLYALCTGHPPFRADTSYGVLRRITDEEPRPIGDVNPEIPPWLEEVVLKLVSKSPGDRFESADAVADVLEECLAHTQHPSTKPLPQSIVTMSCRRRNWPRLSSLLAWASGAILVLLTILLVLDGNRGTLQIVSNAETDIPIRIMQGTDVVEELTISQSGTATRLYAGQYLIEFTGDDTQFQLSGDEVTLERGGIWQARIEVIAPPGTAHIAGGKSTPPAREVTSPEFPPVQVTVTAENGTPIVGAEVTLRKLNAAKEHVELEASDLSADTGVAIDRILPYGEYYLFLTTPDGWHASRRTVQVEFAKGLDLTMIAPNPHEFAEVTLQSDLTFSSPELKKLRFGLLEEHSANSAGWFRVPTPEPDAPLENHASSPTLGDGIEEMALELKLAVTRYIQQPDGEELKWSCTFDDDSNKKGKRNSGRRRSHLASAMGVRAMIDQKWHHAVREKERYFTFSSAYRVTVGAANFTLTEPQTTLQTIEVPAGELSVYITNVHGRSDSNVVRSLGAIDDSETQPLWLPTDIKKDSAWIPRLLDSSDWKSYTKPDHNSKRVVYMDYLLQQTHDLKAGDTARIRLTNPAAPDPASADAWAGDRPGFATPEALMANYAEAQYLNDTVACLNCYSDKVIHSFAVSYLMTAMMMRGDYLPGNGELSPESQVMKKRVEKLIDNAMIDDPPAIASAALLQATRSYSEGFDDETQNASTQDKLLLIASTPSLLTDPRQFVIDFSRLVSEDDEESSSDAEPRKKPVYRIDYDRDDVWATKIGTNDRIGLKRFGDAWLIDDPWGEATEMDVLPPDSVAVPQDR